MDIDKIIDIVRNQKLNEMMGAGAASGPTNNVGDGKIAGTVEAGDDPPVRRKIDIFTVVQGHVRCG